MSDLPYMPVESPILQRQQATHTGAFSTDEDPVELVLTILELAEALLSLLEHQTKLSGKKQIKPELVTTFQPPKSLLPEFMQTLLSPADTSSTGGAAGGK